ncbi:MAG: hypothetical protein JEY97_03895 [Bacteroidales bacterium]|nr:hypothetical protein [Bacteroidales bacterium]
MKKNVLIIVMALFSLTVFSSEEPYKEEMGKNIKSMEKAKSLNDFQELSNKFERIAKAENEKWLPYYYSAFCTINMSFFTKEKCDQYLDEAQKMIDEANRLSPNNSEVETLQGYLYLGRIMRDPQTRGMKYSPMATGCFEKAKALNPNNPRPYYLSGQNLLHTPVQFGGGKTVACPILTIALEKYNSFKPESEISPNWGMKETEELVKNCSK